MILMTSIRDLTAQERAAVACAKGIDAPCFVRFIVEEISVPALNTCAKILREPEKSYEFLCKMFAAAPERTKKELEPIVVKIFMGYASGNFSDFERQKQKESRATITTQ